LGDYKYETYGLRDDSKPDHKLTWEIETKNRASRIAHTAGILQQDEVSEMEWRLRLEELVLSRFRLDIEW